MKATCTMWNGEKAKIASKPYLSLSKHFLISLIFQQLYREILTVADEKCGILDKRVMFYMDEIETLSKVDSLEIMFSVKG